MATVTVDANGVLAIDGEPIFPIGVSEPPPIGATYLRPDNPALRELSRNGVTFVRTGPREFGDLSAPVWGPPEWELGNLQAADGRELLPGAAALEQRFEQLRPLLLTNVRAPASRLAPDISGLRAVDQRKVRGRGRDREPRR